MSRKLRVGLLVNAFEPVAGVTAGGYVHLIETAKRWDQFDLTVFGPESARGAFKSAIPSAKFVAMPSFDRLIKNKALDFLLRAISSPFAKTKLRSCDVLLVQSHFLPDVVPAIAFGARNAIVQIWHVQDAPWKRSGSFVNNLLAYANEIAGLSLVRWAFPTVLVGSDLAARSIGGLSGKALFITTNGVDHGDADASPKEASARRGAAYVGRLHPTKGIDDLLVTWQQVVRRCGPQPLVIVGDGDAAYRQLLEKKIGALGLRDCVAMLGRVSEERKREVLSAARVFVFPSYEEGWGIAIAEAMSAATPCVTYDLDIFREIFPQGRLSAPVGDAEVLAQQVVDLMTDDRLFKRLSGEASSLSEGFTWQSAANIEATALLSLPGAASFVVP